MRIFRAANYRLYGFLPHLLHVQRDKFIEFLTIGIARSLDRINPIQSTSDKANLRIVLHPQSFQLIRPACTPREALTQWKSYDMKLFVPAQVCYGTRPLAHPQWVCVGHIPCLTAGGDLITNGSARVLINQILRRPGMYCKETVNSKTGARVIFIDIISQRGVWARFQIDKKDRMWLVLKKTRKIQFTHVLEAFTIMEHRRGTAALTRNERLMFQRIEERLNLPSDGTGEAAYQFLFTKFKNPQTYTLGRLAREQLNARLGLALDAMQLTSFDLRAIRTYLRSVSGDIRIVDDIDNVANRRFRSMGEQFEAQFDIGLARLEKSVRQNLSTSRQLMSPDAFFDPRYVNQAWRELFARSPLIQFLEQLNPLSDITHKRRMTALGPGGVKRDTAKVEMRNIHPSHYGRICPIETPEGKNVGLVNALTAFARVTSDGVIQTPYFRVVQGQLQKRMGPVYVSAAQEQRHVFMIAPADVPSDFSNTLTSPQVPARLASDMQEEFLRVAPSDIQFIGIGSAQFISIAASLIPFLEHNDANRALMGSNMQRQTVPLLEPERPIVATGLESRVVGESGHTVIAGHGGLVSYASGSTITIHTGMGGRRGLRNAARTLQHYASRVAMRVAMRGAMCLATDHTPHAHVRPHPGLLFMNRFPLGARVDTPYGVDVSNAVIATRSESRRDNRDPHKASVQWPLRASYAKRMRSTCDSRSDAKTERSYTLKIFDRTNQSTAFIQKPRVLEGEWVQKGDLLADCAASVQGGLALGKNIFVAYLPWEGYNFEDAVVISERLLFDDVYSTIHIDRYETEASQNPGKQLEQITSRVPFMRDRDKRALLDNGVIRVSHWVRGGDILVGKILPLKQQTISPVFRLAYEILLIDPPQAKDVSLRVPYGVSGRVVNTYVEHRRAQPLTARASRSDRPKAGRHKPLSVASLRGSHSDDREAKSEKTVPTPTLDYVPSKVRVYLAEKRRIEIGDKVAGRHGNKGIISCVLPRQDMPFLPDGTSMDMVLNPLGVPSRMNVGQVFECLLGLAGSYLGEEFRVTPFDESFGPEASRSLVYLKLYQARLFTQKRWLFQPNFPGKTYLFDGRTGACFEQLVTVGRAYMLKLAHLVEEKIHARNRGKYLKITMQPTKGRAKGGGQRLGEMEVWALEAYGAAYTLQELLTRKSDDIDRGFVEYSFDRPLFIDMARGLPFELISQEERERIGVFGVEKATRMGWLLGTSEAFRLLLLELQGLCLDANIFALTTHAEVPTPTEYGRFDIMTPHDQPTGQPRPLPQKM